MIQIIGGHWRGRRIPVLDRPGLRPTPSRVRETLFNWMGQDLTGLHCLDLFAGSGALGLEAASRHAASVTWVESDDRACQLLRKTLTALTTTPAPTLRVHYGDAWSYVQHCESNFDVIFLDPPFHQSWHERILPQLSRLAVPGALVYAEAEKGLEILAPWQIVKQKRIGSVWSHLLERLA